MKIYRERDITRYFESGSRFVFKTKPAISYTGPIIEWKGRTFAGNNIIAETEKTQELVENVGFGNLIYDSIKEDYVIALPEPTYESFSVSQSDIEKGFIDRYFIEMHDGTIYEVLKPLWKKFSESEAIYKEAIHMVKIKQHTDHAMLEANIQAVNEAEITIPRIREFMSCTDTFQQKDSQYTRGLQYEIEETEEEYVGFYHVMPGMGIMSGRYHQDNSKILQPYNFNNDVYIPKIKL